MSSVYSFVGEAAAPPIEIAKLDTQFADINTALTSCLLRDGTGTPTADLTWTFKLTVNSVAVTSSAVPANGIYLGAANTLSFASNTTSRGSVNSTGNWAILAPSSGIALSVAGIAGTTLANFTTGTGGTSSVQVANTASADGDTARLIVSADAASTQIAVFAAPAAQSTAVVTGGPTGAQTVIRNLGAQPMLFGTNNTLRMTIASTGGITLSTPTSGTAFTVNAFATARAAQFKPGDSSSVGVEILDPGGNGTSIRLNTTNTIGRFQIANAASSMALATNNGDWATVNPAGNITLSAPSSGTALVIGGINGQANATLFEGLNSINAQKNVATYETSSFTGTLTGCTTSPTATFNYSRNGVIMCIDCSAGLTATSNTTSMTVTGMPASLTPARTQVVRCYVTDNSTVKGARCTISGTTLTFDLEQVVGAVIVPTAAFFTNTGTKGVTAGLSIRFALT